MFQEYEVCSPVLCTDGGPVSKKARVERKQPAAIVLDIEGTVTPITFVTQTLFPYAQQRVREHIASTYDTPETQEDIQLLRLLVSILLPISGSCWLCWRRRAAWHANSCVIWIHHTEKIDHEIQFTGRGGCQERALSSGWHHPCCQRREGCSGGGGCEERECTNGRRQENHRPQEPAGRVLLSFVAKATFYCWAILMFTAFTGP